MVKIVGISGSLRKQSYNTALLKAGVTLMPADVSFHLVPLAALPLYNEDLIPENIPESVHLFRAELENADGILIACPEYNYSMTGVLKNALDWASTNTISNLLEKKHVAIMGASKTVFGTVRAQLHLRQVLGAVNAQVVARPEVFIRRAQDVISGSGSIDDTRTISKLANLISTLIEEIGLDK